MRWRKLFGWPGGDHVDPVSDDDRAELAELRAGVETSRQRLAGQTYEIHRVSRYFRGQNDRNHLAERLREAMRGG